MGKEARMKREQSGATKRFDVSEQEGFCLTLFLLNNVQPKDRHEQRRYSRAFTEFQLDPIRRQITSTKDRQLSIDDFREVDIMQVEVANDTLDYVLEVTDKPMVGVHALILLPLQERLLAVKNDAYRSPVGEGATTNVTSINQSGGVNAGEVNAVA